MTAVIYVSYPRQDGINFDVDYYLNTHMQLVQKHWGPHGMKSWHIVQFPPEDPSGLNVQAILFWTSIEDFEKCYALGIPEVHQDLKHYTNGRPVQWKGQVILNSQVK